MRIILIGQAAFGAKVLESLMELNENIVAVYAPPDRSGGRIDPLNASGSFSLPGVAKSRSFIRKRTHDRWPIRFGPEDHHVE